MGIDPPSFPPAPARWGIEKVPFPPRAEPPEAPHLTPLERPKPSAERPVPGGEIPQSGRRTSQAGRKLSGLLVTRMEIDRDAGRVALLSPEAPPVRGDVSTDLDYGLYEMRADTGRHQWVFTSRATKPGLRFRLALDGVEPFDLSYADTFLLVVSRGFPQHGPEAFGALKDRVGFLVSRNRFVEVYEALDLLGDTGLYDLLDELWLEDPFIVNAILLAFNEVQPKGQGIDMPRVLRALESFAVSKEKLYVDNFDKCYVDPKSFGRDEVRERLGKKSNLRLVFTYALMPQRAIVLFADDILDTDWTGDEAPQYGEGELLYPRYCTARTTPRMHAAKVAKIQEIMEQNVQFYMTAYSAVERVINMVVFASGVMMRSTTAVQASMRSPRPVTEAFERQPGRWLPDFEAGLNMSEEAAAYQTRVCSSTRGWGYYVNGVQFDGYKEGFLLDAKFYVEGGRMTKALANQSWWAGQKALNQAARQLAVAGRNPVQWRVASRTAAEKLQQLFRVNDVPIDVVFMP